MGTGGNKIEMAARVGGGGSVLRRVRAVEAVRFFGMVVAPYRAYTRGVFFTSFKNDFVPGSRFSPFGRKPRVFFVCGRPIRSPDLLPFCPRRLRFR